MYPYRCQIVTILIILVFSAEAIAQRKNWWAELAQGYADNTKKPLLDFLADWHSQAKPVSDEILKQKPDFEKALYGLYGTFFKPVERHYENTEYIVIQDRVSVYILNSDLRRVFAADLWDRDDLVRELPPISHLAVRDFRPSLKLDGKKVLYLDYEPLVAMVGFLTDGNMPGPIESYWGEDCEAADRKDRLRYLNSAMKIFPGHWGTGWHFETHPHIKAIYFSSDYRKAYVSYRVYYGGGEALMTRNEAGDWRIVSMEDTWVE